MCIEHRHARGVRRGIAVLSLILPGVALADSALSQSAVVSSATTLIKLASATALVCLVFWAAAWLMKRLQGVTVGTPGGMRVLETLSVGQRERLMIVEAGEHRLLLGVTSQQISLLQERIAPSDRADQVAGSVDEGHFATVLRTVLKGRVSS